MYYGFVCMAVVMFGLQFFCNQKYIKTVGSGAAASMLMILGSSALGALVLLALNRFHLEVTVFTLIWAMVTALNGIAGTFCCLKALGKANLSVYSLFSMLGGMILPFAAGILFYHESMSLGKGLCLAAVTAAMVLTLQKGSGKGAGSYYAGIFIFNGMSGVLSKIFQSATLPKADDGSYSIWSALLSAVLAGLIWLLLKERRVRVSAGSFLWLGGSGALNRVANLLLLIALARLPASVQYPMVTGGVMIVSTLLSYCTPQKPTLRDWGAVVLSFIGIIFSL